MQSSRNERPERYRSVALAAQLLTAVTLVVSIAVVLAVTIQVAEARPLTPTDYGSGGLPAAGLVSLALVALGGLTVLVTGMVHPPRSR
ncbi:hypothetical protein A33M_1957 [Rhodovulum sp. PH10]|nr:hypothetical protein A33M_1957 [Rhodovulum sp. PH10]